MEHRVVQTHQHTSSAQWRADTQAKMYNVRERVYQGDVGAKVVEFGLRGAEEAEREGGVDVIEQHGLRDVHSIRLRTRVA
jgi:hypothetical protein